MSWEINLFILSISDLVNEQQRLLVVKLDVINFVKILFHVGFAKRFLAIFLGLMSKREVNVVKIPSNQNTINLIRSRTVFGNYGDSAFVGVATVILCDNFILFPALSELFLHDLHDRGLVYKSSTTIDV